jgi:hypothetical protein
MQTGRNLKAAVEWSELMVTMLTREIEYPKAFHGFPVSTDYDEVVT